MGDVKLAAQTHVSKTSLTVDHSRVSSMPLTEAPAFTLPPRNLCIKEGATAKFEGRVSSEAEWAALAGSGVVGVVGWVGGWGSGRGLGSCFCSSLLSRLTWQKACFPLDPHIKCIQVHRPYYSLQLTLGCVGELGVGEGH